jgi:hypothetical protein
MVHCLHQLQSETDPETFAQHPICCQVFPEKLYFYQLLREHIASEGLLKSPVVLPTLETDDAQKMLH